MQKHDLWITIAAYDFKAANLLQEGALGNQAAYFAHQTAEKALKGYLVAFRLPIQKTHDLAILLRACVGHSAKFNTLIDNAKFLSPYSTRSRYPDDYELLRGYESAELVKHAKKILHFVQDLLL